ncbi:MAG: hypothetical protein ACJAYU_003269 [Bradymonadia bacterium]|jgi:hypothetical protein
MADARNGRRQERSTPAMADVRYGRRQQWPTPGTVHAPPEGTPKISARHQPLENLKSRYQKTLGDGLQLYINRVSRARVAERCARLSAPQTGP